MLEKLSQEHIVKILKQALHDEQRGLGEKIDVADEGVLFIRG